MLVRLLTTLAVASLLLAPIAGSAATAPDKFVRTANYFLLSGTTLDNQDTVNALAKYDLLVLPAEAQVFNQDFFPKIRALNPDIIILAYVPSVSYNNLYWSDALHIQLKKGIQSSWWLKNGSGGQVSLWANTSALNVNSGWTDYLAGFVATNILATNLWDGVFYDEVDDSISWVGPVDTNGDDQADAASVADANWKQGYQNLFAATRAQVGSTRIIIDNGSSDSRYSSSVNGRLFESFPTPWEGNGAWSTVMKNYLRLEDETVKDPIIVVDGDTNNTGNQTDYQDMRFALTSTLLGNGYFAYDFGTQSHAQLWTYDEESAYLGEPKGDPEDLLNATNTTMQDSVWGRDFADGKVVVNATSSTQTVTLGGDYEKLHGTQDATVNNGSIISKLTLSPKDGVVLLRPIEKIDDAAFLNGSFARIFDNTGATKRTGFFAYDAAYKGGQHVVHFDLNGDGMRETIVANATDVKIYNSDGSLHADFYPYTSAYNLGINIAVGDIENDGSVEIVTGTEKGGGPQLRVFNKDGVLINPGFFAYDTAFRGGVHVAIGDLNGDNIKEIIAGAGETGGPHVRVFNKAGTLINPGFFAYDENFRGGVRVAAGDVDGDGVDDIVTAPGPGGGPHVRVYDRDGNLKTEFFAFDPSDTRGIDVLATDVDGDGKAEIVSESADVFTFSLF